MYPGPYVYFSFMALALLAGISIFTLLARQAGWTTRTALHFNTSIAIGALIGACLYHMLEYHTFGMRLPGGLLGALLVAPLVPRPQQAWLATADLAAPATAGAMLVMRLGCFMQGCCSGVPSNLSWAIQFPGQPGMVHPLQLYFALGNLFVLFTTLWLMHHKARMGQVAGFTLLCFACMAILLDPLRAQPQSSLAWYPLGVLGLIWLYWS